MKYGQEFSSNLIFIAVMWARVLALLLMSATQSGFGDDAAKPSFDCGKTTTRVENAICSDDWLPKADALMAREFADLKGLQKGDSLAALKLDQSKWLEERNHCKEAVSDAKLKDCLRDLYNERNRVLGLMKRSLMLAALEAKLAGGGPETAYRDEVYGFELRYPKFLRVSRGNAFVADGGQNPYKSLLEIELDSQLAVRVGVVEGSGAVASCRTAGANQSKKMVNGHEFLVSEFGDVGLGSWQGGKSLKRFRRGRCYVVERLDRGSSYSDGEGYSWLEKVNKQVESLEKYAERITESFRFIDK